MKESKGICATEWGWYGLFAALGVFAAGFGVWRSLSEFTQDAFMLVIAGIYAFCWGAYHVIEQQYLDEDGITIRRFGKSVRFLDWRDVAQVHKIHR